MVRLLAARPAKAQSMRPIRNQHRILVLYALRKLGQNADMQNAHRAALKITSYFALRLTELYKYEM